MSTIARAKQGAGATAGQPAQPEIVPADQRISIKTAPPDFLTDPAKEFWVRTLPQLSTVMRSEDLTAFSQLCVAYGAYVAAATDLKERGLTVLTDKGNTVKNPSWMMFRESTTFFNALDARFGLNPSERAKPLKNTAPDAKPSALSKLIK